MFAGVSGSRVPAASVRAFCGTGGFDAGVLIFGVNAFGDEASRCFAAGATTADAVCTGAEAVGAGEETVCVARFGFAANSVFKAAGCFSDAGTSAFEPPNRSPNSPPIEAGRCCRAGASVFGCGAASGVRARATTTGVLADGCGGLASAALPVDELGVRGSAPGATTLLGT